MAAPAVITSRATFLETARSADDAAGPAPRIPVEVRTTVEDPFEAYRRTRTPGGGSCYLETTGGQPGWGYLGVDPIERLQVREGAVAIAGGGRSPTLAALEGRLAGERLLRGDCEVPYPCGAIGWLSYDVVRELEELPSTAAPIGAGGRPRPRLQLAVFDRLAAWREPRPADGPTRVHVTACPRLDGDAGRAYETGRRRALALARRLEGDTADEDGPDERPPVAVEGDVLRVRSAEGRARFERMVRSAKRAIRDGETFQVNLSHRLVAPAAVHPVRLFAALRRVNPAPYSALLEFPGLDLVGASPELLLRVEGRRLTTEPIAGTRPRGRTAEDDERLERELRDDEKERAEHAMLVDLERNDLGKVCEYGTVTVPEYRRVDRYASVMHLVSVVTGRRRPDAGLADVVGAVFPGGTVTGAPKPRTMAIIDELEASRRGPYTGSVGIFGFDGRATLNIVIRTVLRQGPTLELRVGAGIVHDSQPGREYDETIDKARGVLRAIEAAGAGTDDGGDAGPTSVRIAGPALTAGSSGGQERGGR